MNRAQPTNRASGVHCTAWLEGRGHGRTHAIRRVRPAVFRTHGHGTRGYAPPLTSTRAARDSPAHHAVDQHARRTGLACAPTGRASTGRHPPGHDGPRSNGPSSAGPRRAAPQRAVIPAGTPRASDSVRPAAIRSRPTSCAGKPPNRQALAAPLGTEIAPSPRNRASGVSCTPWLDGRGRRDARCLGRVRHRCTGRHGRAGVSVATGHALATAHGSDGRVTGVARARSATAPSRRT